MCLFQLAHRKGIGSWRLVFIGVCTQRRNSTEQGERERGEAWLSLDIVGFLQGIKIQKLAETYKE